VEPPGSTGGLRGRKWSLYEGGIREPLIVRQTGRIPAGRLDTRSVVSTLDFFPTFCRVAGVTPPHVNFDGEDASGVFFGHPRERRRDLFWEYGRDEGYPYPGRKWDRSPNCAIRSGRWKLLANADGSGPELYDLSRSELERENCAAAEPRRARELSERLLAWRRSLPSLPAEVSS
jgi:arylsulfatase A-like enzyme